MRTRVQDSKLKTKNSPGQLTLQLLIFGGVAVILLAGFLAWLDAITKTVVRAQDREQAFETAEAGIEYYRWHLAHAPTDYQDGTTSTGPYTHNYYDKDGNLLGQFILNITPPPLGSSIVTVQSTGKITADPTVQKSIKVRMGIPSFAQFAAVLNDNVRFGQGTQVFGPIMSNYGIRFDGLAHNLVSSALTSYQDPDHAGCCEYGAHTHIVSSTGSVDNNFQALEAPPNPLLNRPDVFIAGRQISVPAVDFTGITLTLAQMQTASLTGGFHASSSGSLGYDIVLRTDHTFDFYKVTRLTSPASSCTNVLNQTGWGSWSINRESFLGNYPMPGNGIIFVNDNAWVRGQINGSRVTIASAVFPDNPSTRTSITVNNSLTYTSFDGTDVIALIAQNNVNIGMVSDDTLTVDGALMAQNGRVGRFYYQPPNIFGNGCSPYHVRTSITAYGMIASNQRYGFAYTDGTGYQTRNLNYDSNLLYGPPPSFPLTTNGYKTISWDETQ